MTNIKKTEYLTASSVQDYEFNKTVNQKPSLFMEENSNNNSVPEDNFYGDAISISHNDSTDKLNSTDLPKTELSNELSKNYTNQLQLAIDTRYKEVQAKNQQLIPNDTDYDINQKRWKGLVERAETQTSANSQKIMKTLSPMLPDLGNGKIDKPAKQISNDCWLVGGINSLSVTDAGQKLLNNNIYKDENKHIIAIHLQEAENKKLPQPNGDGIYTFTEKEIFDAQKRNSEQGLVSGDGDITAFALAIDSYLNSTYNGILPEGKQHFSDGQHVSRIYEILTGAKRNDTNNFIKYKFLEDTNSKEEVFNEIYSTIENKKGASTVNIGNHAFSVVDVDNTSNTKSLLIQESNLSEGFTQYFELMPNSYPPTYKLPLDKFGEYVHDYGILNFNP